jgi:hypothetical protein
MEDDFGTLGSQRASDLHADAAGGGSHQRGFAFQVQFHDAAPLLSL